MEQSQWCQQEAEILWLLGAVTAQAPELQQLQQMRSTLHASLQGASEQVNHSDSIEVKLLSAINQSCENQAQWLALKQDYVDIFACVKKQTDYISPMQSLAQPGCDDIIQLHNHLNEVFKQCGFKPPVAHGHAPDHLSTLLYLLAVIRHHQANTPVLSEHFEHLTRLFDYVLKNHLQAWVLTFAQQAITRCKSAFYQAILLLLQNYMQDYVDAYAL